MKEKVPISSFSVLKALARGAVPYRFLFAGSVLFFTAGTLINVVVPLFYKRFFDFLEKGVAADELIRVLVLIAILHGCYWLTYRVAILMHHSMQTAVMAKLRQNAFEYLMRHSHNFFASNFTGSLVQRVGRFSRSFERLSDSLVYNIIPLAVTITGAVIITFT